MAGPYLGELLAVGIGKEATYGAFVNSTDWLACQSCSLEKKPNPIIPSMLRQSRNLNPYGVEGIRSIAGDIALANFTDEGMRLLALAFGSETATTGSSASNATTLSSGASAGATQISTVATFTTNTYVQVDSTGSGKAEVRKVTAVSGSGPYTVTLGTALSRAHSSGVAVANVVAPYTHTFAALEGILPSFSCEKIMQALEIQYGGLVVDKAAIKMTLTAEPAWTYSCMGQQEQYVASPPTPTYSTTDSPFSPTAIVPQIATNGDLTLSAIDLTIDNGCKAVPAFNGESYPQIVVPGRRQISAKVTTWLQALTGGLSVFDYFSGLQAAGSSDLNVVLTNGTSSLTLDMPHMVIQDYTNPTTGGGDIFRCNLTMAGLLVPGGADITATLINSNPLNYV